MLVELRAAEYTEQCMSENKGNWRNQIGELYQCQYLIVYIIVSWIVIIKRNWDKGIRDLCTVFKVAYEFTVTQVRNLINRKPQKKQNLKDLQKIHGNHILW